uniref:Sterile alpha motif domain-containing protein 3 n=1 Tax=Dicentrarchus labrax TaxID=13489 RepID=A0A8P4KR70_DICLA
MDLPLVPDTVEELIEQVKEACKLTGGIRLQYKDIDFGGKFVNLSSTSPIKDLTTIKVIQSVPDTDIILKFIESGPADSSDLDSSSLSIRTDSDDTIILSSSSSERLRTEPWPKEFNIPTFSFETEYQLEKGNAKYTKDQTRLTPTSKMLSDILERLAEKIFSYKAYPTDADLGDVAEVLTRKHPCLRQADSYNESYGWKLRLKSKMGNYRTQLKSHGLASELMVNTLKSKSREDPLPRPAKNNKKARRGEANYYPQPSTETTKAKTATILEFHDQMSEKDQAEQELESTTMPIFVLRENSSLLQQPKETGIIIDGVEVLNELPSVAAGVVMLFELCYALNMEYPQGGTEW